MERLCLLLLLYVIVIIISAKKEEPESVRMERAMRMKQTWADAVKKIVKYLRKAQEENIAIEHRNLVLFHIMEFNGGKDSQDVPMNNVKLFVSAILQHSNNGSNDQHAFYLFSVGSGAYNAFFKFLPLELPNTAYVEWPGQAGEKDTPIRTSLMLGLPITSNFTSITVTSDRVRGPLVGRYDGEWLRSFRHLLDKNNVGIVGSSISCDNYAHVQPHMYMFRTSMLSAGIKAAKRSGKLRDDSIGGLMHLFKDGLSNAAVKLGYGISSILTHARLQQYYFDGTCIPGVGSPDMPVKNPTSWCNIKPEEVIFLKWGGVPLRTYGGVCIKQIQAVQNWLVDLTINDAVLKHDSHLQLTLPETLHGGLMYELQRMYNLEMWKDRSPRMKLPGDVKLGYNQNVCFAVVVSKKHDYDEQVRRATLFLKVTLDGMIKSLLRQSNPYWSAFFVNIDEDELFDARLREILFSVNDPRVVYHRRFQTAKKKMTMSHDKYAMFDTILREIALQPECKYITITSGDNFYGSQVVQQVLDARVDEPPYPLDNENEVNDALLKEMSRSGEIESDAFNAALNSAKSDGAPLRAVDLPRFKEFSKESPLLPATYSKETLSSPYQPASSWETVFTKGLIVDSSTSKTETTPKISGLQNELPDVILNPLDSKLFAEQEYTHRESMRPAEEEYTERCVGIDAMTALHLLPYTVQPNPFMGRINFAAVFINRDRYIVDGISFGNVTIPSRIQQNCFPCQDGYLIEYLVRYRHWKYARLPKDGFKSIVFHGPSPSLCIASGNVWFDYPSISKVGCLAQKTVSLLKKQDIPERANFDWKHFNLLNKVCLRLTEHGFSNKDDLIFQ